MPPTQQRKRLWAAIGGTLVFTAIGVVVLPGLARYEQSSGSQARVPVRPPEPAGENTSAPEPALAAQSPSAPRYRPVRDTFLSPRDFDCMIAPNEVIEIGSAITGLIDQIDVERSDYVEQDQVLVRLESSVEEATVRLAQEQAAREVEIESSRANLQLLEKRMQRARNLFHRESLSVDGREQVETEALLASLDLRSAQTDSRILALQLDQAVAALDRRTIRSPVAGFVVDRLMSEGEVVDEETILRIAQVDPLRVEVILPSTMFGRIQTGQRAEVYAETGLEEALSAEVEIVDRIIDGPSGTFGARLLLPNPDHSLPAGLRCQVRFVDPSEQEQMLSGQEPAAPDEVTAAASLTELAAQGPPLLP